MKKATEKQKYILSELQEMKAALYEAQKDKNIISSQDRFMKIMLYAVTELYEKKLRVK